MDFLKLFEIEPKQKSVITIFIAVFGISILQTYFFKRQLYDSDLITLLSFTFGISVCNFLINFPAAALFFASIREDENDVIESLILIAGIFMLLWISLLSYISFEFNISFVWYIRMSIIVGFSRFIFWTLFVIIKTNNEIKKNKNK